MEYVYPLEELKEEVRYYKADEEVEDKEEADVDEGVRAWGS